MEKRNFLIQMMFKEAVFSLTDEAAGQVFKGLFSYVAGDAPGIKSESGRAVFLCIKTSIDSALKRYEERCEKNRENIKKRYNRIQSNTNVYECIPNDNDNDDDDDDDDDNITHPLAGVCENSSRFSRARPFFFDEDLEEIRIAWNEKGFNFPKVVKLESKNRKGKMVICLMKLCDFYQGVNKAGIIQKVCSYIEKINGSFFLQNECKGKITFDWFFNESNFLRVIEGAYDNE